MTPEIINLLVMIAATAFTANHARAAWKHRSAKGVSILSTLFFTCMAVWQAIYMATLHQWWSLAGASMMALAHFVWLVMLINYRSAESLSDIQLQTITLIPNTHTHWPHK